MHEPAALPQFVRDLLASVPRHGKDVHKWLFRTARVLHPYRTLASTGSRRFLVVEFDTGTAHEHAALLLHLARHAPLVLAVHSAGKSLHGWFYGAAQAEKTTLRFMRYAVSLGADDQLGVRSQFARMPDGTRDNGKRQVVHYFNPERVTETCAKAAKSAKSAKSAGGY